MAYVEILCGNFKTRKKGATFNETRDPLPTFVMNGGITMIESLQERLYKSEQLIAKQATMIKKLTVAVNKLLKGSE